MDSSTSSPACSGDGGTYVAVIRSGLSRRFGGCFFSIFSRSTDGFTGPTAPQSSARAGSSCASDMVSLPPGEAYTVQTLMDLALPRFAGLGDGPRHLPEEGNLFHVSPVSPGFLTRQS